MKTSLRFSWPILLGGLAPALFFAQTPTRLNRAIDNQQRMELKGNVRRQVKLAQDRGTAPPDLALNRMLLLLKRSPEQEAALQQLLVDQQVPSSPRYHQWLTPQQFGAQFGPAEADIATVTRWLTAEGFRVERVAPGRNVIEFSGTAAGVANAFGTEMHRYELNGKAHWANASDPTLPVALAPVVAGVVSLNNFVKPGGQQRAVGVGRLAAAGEPQPAFTFTGSGGAVEHALVPADFAVLYNVAPLYAATPAINGTGQTIAIVGRSQVNMQDVQNFRNVFGVQPTTNVPKVIVNGPDPGDIGGGDEGEADLDLEWSGAVAPNATIDFVVSATTDTTDGIDLSSEYIVDNNLAPVMSTSFAGCEAGLGQAENQFISSLYEQAAAQGITVIDSSGDSGAAGCDPNDGSEQTATGGLGVSGLASTPFNVAVGGTQFNEGNGTFWNATNDPTTGASAMGPIPEVAWNESCINKGCDTNGPFSASGGGASAIYNKPPWQQAPGVPGDSARDVPDISFSAAGHDGYVVCDSGSGGSGGAFPTGCQLQPGTGGGKQFGFLVFGGTSASTPSFAGVMAMVNQKTNSVQGQANYTLYNLARNKENYSACNASTGTPSASCIFLDTTVGNNSVPCASGSSGCSNGVLKGFSAGTGYDQVTGLGSINVTNMVNNWASGTASRATTTTLTLTPTNTTHGQAVTITAVVNQPGGGGIGAITGDIALIALTGPTGQQGVDFATLQLGACGGSQTCATGTENGFPGGTYGVIARYSGDMNFAPSTSNTVPVTVAPEASNTTLAGFEVNSQFQEIPITQALYGDLIFLDANVQGAAGVANNAACIANAANCINDGVPTGTVTFSNNGGTFAPPNLNNGQLPSVLALNTEGQASYPGGITTLPVGTYSLTGAYSGDASFNVSTSASLGLTVLPSPTTTSATSAAVGTGQTKLTASIDTNGSLGLPPTGTVNFISGSTNLGSAPVTGTNNGSTGVASGTATLTITTPNGGVGTVTGVYSGDANYSGTTPFTVSASPAAANISAGGTASYTITLTPIGSFTGNVTLSCSGLPGGGSCAFAPPSVALAGTAAGTSKLTISLAAGAAAPVVPTGPARRPLAPWLVLLGLAPLPLLWRRRRWAGPAALALLMLGAAACGGGNNNTNNGGTPTPFSVSIVASSGNFTTSQSVTLNVQ